MPGMALKAPIAIPKRRAGIVFRRIVTVMGHMAPCAPPISTNPLNTMPWSVGQPARRNSDTALATQHTVM